MTPDWMTRELAFAVVGGVGLLLIGMTMLTEGLRLSAGNALRRILDRWTSTTFRGLASGALITALVQSSSAVTVATIGFVNAGVLSLGHAIAVVFGSNVGTTATGWIVAAIGLDVDIDALALPLIGVGGLVHLLRPGTRLAAAGQAAAGFGLFFMGIDLLQSSFAGLAETVDPGALSGRGLGSLLLTALLGFGLTTVMQSSSAAIAITLSAAAGGALTLDGAAAMVIGANVGTTSTGALAAIGATANARRVAAAHIAFNLLTGAVAFGILPLLLRLLGAVQERTGTAGDIATALALFHTTFNVLGVVLCAPFVGRFERMLMARFRTHEEDEARPRHLDANLVGTPALAVVAVKSELGRIGEIARRLGAASLSAEGHGGAEQVADRRALRALNSAVTAYVAELQRQRMAAPVSDAVGAALALGRYYVDIADMAEAVVSRGLEAEPLRDAGARATAAEFLAFAAATLTEAVPGGALTGRAGEERVAEIGRRHAEARLQLLRAGAEHRISSLELVQTLEKLDYARRMAKRATRALRLLSRVEGVEPSNGDVELGPDEAVEHDDD